MPSGPQDPTCVCSHLCATSPALSSFLLVALVILTVGLVISTPGIVGTSPTVVCRVAGSRSQPMAFGYTALRVLCVCCPVHAHCPARTLSTVSAVLACKFLSKWGRLALKCLTEMGGRVSGCQWHERAVVVVTMDQAPPPCRPLTHLPPWRAPPTDFHLPVPGCPLSFPFALPNCPGGFSTTQACKSGVNGAPRFCFI